MAAVRTIDVRAYFIEEETVRLLQKEASAAYLYRKPKPGHSGGKVHLGSGMN